MYFKIAKESATGKKLDAIWDRVFAVRKAMALVVAELSDMEDPGYFVSPNYLAGKMYGIQFKENPGKPWIEIKKHQEYGSHYYQLSAVEAKKKDSALYKKFISADDPIQDDDLCSILGLKSGTAGSFTWYRRPGLQDCDTHYVLSIPDEWAIKYKNDRPSDMVEILASEYHLHLEVKKAKTP
jgi:hypothetical protein